MLINIFFLISNLSSKLQKTFFYTHPRLISDEWCVKAVQTVTDIHRAPTKIVISKVSVLMNRGIVSFRTALYRATFFVRGGTLLPIWHAGKLKGNFYKYNRVAKYSVCCPLHMISQAYCSLRYTF